MKRAGHIIEEIIKHDNLYDSLRYVLRGRIGETDEGRRLLDNAEAVIASLQQEIEAGTYHISEYHEYTVKKGLSIIFSDLYITKTGKSR